MPFTGFGGLHPILPLALTSAKSKQSIRELSMKKSFSGPAKLTLALLCFFLRIGTAVGQPQVGSAEAEFFKSKILPILASRCQSCHNHTLKLSGLNLESAAAFETGG